MSVENEISDHSERCAFLVIVVVSVLHAEHILIPNKNSALFHLKRQLNANAIITKHQSVALTR